MVERTQDVEIVVRHPLIGAEVRWVDLDQPIDEATFAVLYAAWMDHLPPPNVTFAQAGETVFIHGASGSVGIAAMQLAKLAGLKVVAFFCFATLAPTLASSYDRRRDWRGRRWQSGYRR